MIDKTLSKTDKLKTSVDSRISSSPNTINLNQGEQKMADIVTGTTTGFVDTSVLQAEHSDIRREGAEHTGQLLQENLKGFDRVNADVLRSGWAGVDATKDARHEVSDRVENSADRITSQASDYFISAMQSDRDAARDLASLKVLTDANAGRLSSEIQLNVEKAAAAAALSGEKIAAAVALGQSILSKEVFADGQRTRDLINDLKYHDLNRSLVERNAELVEERHGRRHYRDRCDQNQYAAQWATVQSQLQAFASQLQDTRQGMVNFGTQTGVGQTSTSNNVR